MKNKYVVGDGCVAIKVSGSGKYNLNVLINASRFDLVNRATNGYWEIIKDHDMYYAGIKDASHITYMHDLITGMHMPYCEEKFIYPHGTNHLVSNPFFTSKESIIRAIPDGLCNLDDNLMIGHYPTLTEDDLIAYETYGTPILQKLTDRDMYELSFKEIINSDGIDQKEVLMAFKTALVPLLNLKFVRRFNSLKHYQHLLNMINQEQFGTDSFSDVALDLSLQDIDSVQDDIERSYGSWYLFPDHLVITYPKIKDSTASKDHLCIFSGAEIHKYSKYLAYKVLVEDITDGQVYGLRHTLCAEHGYEHDLPRTISDLDSFQYGLMHAYDNPYYYNIVCNMKSNSLPFVKLRKK